MPTCEESTVTLVDRGGGLSSQSVRVKFTFRSGPIPGSQVIAAVQLVGAGAPSPNVHAIDAKGAQWRMFGSTDVGAGELVHSGGSEERIFLITRRRKRTHVSEGQSQSEECCEALELLAVRSVTQFTLDETLLLMQRMAQLLTQPARPRQVDCDEGALLR